MIWLWGLRGQKRGGRVWRSCEGELWLGDSWCCFAWSETGYHTLTGLECWSTRSPLGDCILNMALFSER